MNQTNVQVDYDPTTGEPRWLLVGDDVYAVGEKQALPSFDEADDAGFDATLRGYDGRPVGVPVTRIDIDRANRQRVIDQLDKS